MLRAYTLTMTSRPKEVRLMLDWYWVNWGIEVAVECRT